MRLTLNVLRCPDAAVPESRSSHGADITIGRGLDCDWVLQDPERVLSKRHCVLEFRGGYWQVRDTSTNGTFLNGAAEPVGRDMVAPLSDGDRLRLGSYEIEVRIAADAAAPGPAWGEAAIGSRAGPGRPAADPFANPFAPPPGATGLDTGGLPGIAGNAAGPLPGGAGRLPDDWDPFTDEEVAGAAAPMPDHAPATSDAFLPPRPAPLPPAGPAAIPEDWDPFGDTPPRPAAAPPAASPPAGGGLPMDWDPLADLAPPAATPPASPTTAPTPPPAPPIAVPPLPPAPPIAVPQLPPAPPIAAPPSPAPPPPLGRAPGPHPVTPSLASRGPAIPPAAQPESETEPPRPAVAPVAPGSDTRADPFAEDGVPSRSIPATGAAPAAAAPAAPPAAPAAADPDAAVAALLRGAGITPGALHGAAAEQPLAILEQAGATLRAAVAGLRALLIARADVKREFRIEQTMLRAVGNNPVKFAATDEAAIAALLTGGARATQAVAETVGDLTAHEVATLAATQAAARALLAKLAPEVVEEADPGGGGGLFGGGREKRLWDAYRRLHAKVVEQFEDDFDSAFGKEFARAYEQAVAAKDDGTGEGGRRR